MAHVFSLFRKQPKDDALCQSARRMLVWVFGCCVLLAVIIAADFRLRVKGQADHAVAWMQVLTLSAPALWTVGSPSRHPETIHPGVDLRFAAGLERSP